MSITKPSTGTITITLQSTVAVGVLALAIQGGIGNRTDSGVANRITALEARQVEYERLWREERNEIRGILREVENAVKRIEGKLEDK